MFDVCLWPKCYIIQIECGKPWSPPLQCKEYHTGVSGTFKSWNFDDSNNIHSNDLAYSICIRREKGYCGYSVTPANEPLSFVWDQATRGRGGAICRTDNFSIPGSSLDGRGLSLERYCGNILVHVEKPPTGPSVSDTLITYRTPFR